MTVDEQSVSTTNDLTFITIEFLQHSNTSYRQAHHKLNTQYGSAIEVDAVKEIFDKNRSDICSILLPKVVEAMELDPDGAVIVTQMFNSGAMVFKWILHKSNTFC